MTTYSDTIYPAATDPTSTLRRQVTVAVAKAAHDIVNEDPATLLHDERLSWARRMLGGAVESMAAKMIWEVLQNATIQTGVGDADPATPSDADVLFVVNGILNNFLHA